MFPRQSQYEIRRKLNYPNHHHHYPNSSTTTTIVNPAKPASPPPRRGWLRPPVVFHPSDCGLLPSPPHFIHKNQVSSISIFSNISDFWVKNPSEGLMQVISFNDLKILFANLTTPGTLIVP
ncbi:hypothetical protein LIER_43560 [Lithospermum erythrorhizon]|uniref:Uncharacterized protein n=1 Tax=Lithospermum erythrorhizon TaxID=34254 RepID=A0AAV3QAU5_LITER